MAATPKTTYHLHTFFASSCAARIRIALNLKKIPVTSHYIDMQKAEHESQSYRALNPSASIPTLIVETSSPEDPEGEKTTQYTLTQSVAILEFLEETFPEQVPLLPKDAQGRARVRELMYIVTSDIFPPTNNRIVTRVKNIRDSKDDESTFAKTIMTEGFAAYEQLLERHAKGKKYSAGDEVTLADVCLVPQVEQARFYGVDFAQWPLLAGVIGRLEALEAFREAGWKRQGDTPEKFRVRE